MCFQGVDGHRSPGSLQLFVPVVPHFRHATWTRALFTFYLRDLQLVSSKAAFPLSEGNRDVSGWVGAAPLPMCGWQGLQGTRSTSVTGGRLVSSPANRNPLAQGWGDKHNVSTHCS